VKEQSRFPPVYESFPPGLRAGPPFLNFIIIKTYSTSKNPEENKRKILTMAEGYEKLENERSFGKNE
jgi:hypothetical protein